MSGFDLAEVLRLLSRDPDFDAPELQAWDATDEYLLDVAFAPDSGIEAAPAPAPGELVVIGDRHGALTLGAAALGATGIRTHQDALLGERALAANVERLRGKGLEVTYSSLPLGEALLKGARRVLLQLPRGLDALDEIAWSIARWAAPDVRVFAGGRVKHMTLAQNEVLGRYFGEVRAGRAHRKSRIITASAPRELADAGSAPYPTWGEDSELPFALAAHGATFGGPTLDHGSRLLLSTLRDTNKGDAQSAPARVVDLGCGNGSLAVGAATAWPEARVIATDQSAAAVAATEATAERAGVLSARGHETPGVTVFRADATEAVPDGWADLIILNPPFHTGSTVHAGVAHRLIRACRRALTPGGELRVVFNSHLRYRPLIEREIGPVAQQARDRTFTVLSARRPTN